MAKDLTQALHEATLNAQGQTSRQNTKLPAAKPVSAIPARNGTGRPGGGATGSIASPLTEGLFSTRQHWPEQVISSTDGIFVIKIKPIKQMSFTDANGQPVQMLYAEPT